ncbi:FAD-dependent oxidoreductase [Radicibacter daui]|uniref:FAD-dependent oxidoreductase n=1 Tax=Radicibacter daui TaxID=3064829 RepID=UPI004046B86D
MKTALEPATLPAPADLIVIGAGPAGAEAAMSAAAQGLRVLLLDEAVAAGGQVYRAPHAGDKKSASSPEAVAGNDLRARLEASTVECHFGETVWSVSPGFRVDSLSAQGTRSWHGRALITATGASERVVPFPGWTLPGVIGLAGATILLKSQGILPGRRTLIAGCGPLLLAVAAGILAAGGEVAAVADLSPRSDWLRKFPRLASRPDLLLRGAGWLASLKRTGVPVFSAHTLKEVVRDGDQLVATLQPVDGARRPVTGPEPHFAVDAVTVGHGLVPGTDVTRLLRARHHYDFAQGGWAPDLDGNFRTNLPGLYAVGDGTGIAGAATASLNGQLAGLAAARDLGALADTVHEQLAARLEQQAAKAGRFGRAMAELMALRPAQVAAISPETVVCRCEDVTRAEIDSAIEDGARTVNQLKSWTRCGMGPCQGRMCGDVATALMAQATGEAPVAPFTGRTPFRPLPISQFAGDCDYGDIKLPPPAPL